MHCIKMKSNPLLRRMIARPNIKPMGMRSIYQAADDRNVWPNADDKEKLPENIWTHTKLPNNFSKKHQFYTGHVVSTGMQKTIAVAVKHKWEHPKYGKLLTRVKKFFAHDETELARIGDKVELQRFRPLSRKKRWILHKIVDRVGYMSDPVNCPVPEVPVFKTIPQNKPRKRAKARQEKRVIRTRKKEERRVAKLAAERAKIQKLHDEVSGYQRLMLKKSDASKNVSTDDTPKTE